MQGYLACAVDVLQPFVLGSCGFRTSRGKNSIGLPRSFGDSFETSYGGYFMED